MKSLQEIEPRTMISSAPSMISAPGSYYLSNNITVSSGDAITISSGGVTLDLNGFTIVSTAASPTGAGIRISGSISNVAIFNGFVRGGVRDNNGTFSGPGFYDGINGTNAFNVRVSDIGVSGCANYGIYLNNYAPNTVERCSVKTVGGPGIDANIVKGSSAFDCGGLAVNGYQVSDSSGQCVVDDDGLRASEAVNCYGESVGPDSQGLIANLANNCYGTTINGYNGLAAATAISCYGEAFNTNNVGVNATDCVGCYGHGGSAGILAYGTLSGCYGESFYGYGIYAPAAENCNGYSSTLGGTTHYAGLYADSAHNCYGYSYYDPGVQSATANNCFGYSTFGNGINGTSSNTSGSAENCYGYSEYSDGIVVLNAQNCYGEGLYGDGLYAYTANNCYGVTTYNYYGIYSWAANNCYGTVRNSSQSYTTAIQATVANNCYGYNGSVAGTYGYGIAASSADNCYGYSESPYGYGLYGTVASVCVGYDYATGGVGLGAFIANCCTGGSLSLTHNVNSF
jgi:hypothetical protein